VGSNSLDFLLRCQNYGHDVMMFNKPRANGTIPKAGHGIIPVLHDYDALMSKWLGWADLIFLPDNVLYLAKLEPFRKMGYPVFAAPEAAVELELDREFGQKTMKSAGIDILPYRIFHDYDSAIRYVTKENRAFVSKPSGDANKALSYVAHDRDDMLYMLERWRENTKLCAYIKEFGFILQDKMDGVEIAVGGWFGPGGFSKWFCENVEYKKLMPGDLGVNTGEQGTLARYVTKSKLAEKVLLPLTETLHSMGYVGYIDVNCIVSHKTGNPWPVEITARNGWPITHNQMALHLGDPAQWMRDLVDGRDTLEVQGQKVCISVVVTIPDFPYSRVTNKEVEGIPILEFPNDERFHPVEIMLGEAPRTVGEKVVRLPCWCTSGDYVAVVTGVGDTINDARARAYPAVKRIRMPNDPQWRHDIGRGRLVKGLPILHKHGYATGLRYD
jgi:phosphoribosylamine---glycine ligase